MLVVDFLKEGQPLCEGRVLRLLLERSIRLQTLSIIEQVYDINDVFKNVSIHAPMKILSLRTKNFASVETICQQLAGSLEELCLFYCEKITIDGLELI